MISIEFIIQVGILYLWWLVIFGGFVRQLTIGKRTFDYIGLSTNSTLIEKSLFSDTSTLNHLPIWFNSSKCKWINWWDEMKTCKCLMLESIKHFVVEILHFLSNEYSLSICFSMSSTFKWVWLGLTTQWFWLDTFFCLRLTFICPLMIDECCDRTESNSTLISNLFKLLINYKRWKN